MRNSSSNKIQIVTFWIAAWCFLVFVPAFSNPGNFQMCAFNFQNFQLSWLGNSGRWSTHLECPKLEFDCLVLYLSIRGTKIWYFGFPSRDCDLCRWSEESHSFFRSSWKMAELFAHGFWALSTFYHLSLQESVEGADVKSCGKSCGKMCKMGVAKKACWKCVAKGLLIGHMPTPVWLQLSKGLEKLWPWCLMSWCHVCPDDGCRAFWHSDSCMNVERFGNSMPCSRCGSWRFFSPECNPGDETSSQDLSV